MDVVEETLQSRLLNKIICPVTQLPCMTNRWYSALSSEINEFIIDFDNKNKIVSASENLQLLGIRDEDILNISIAQLIYEDDKKTWAKLVKSARIFNEEHQAQSKTEVRFVLGEKKIFGFITSVYKMDEYNYRLVLLDITKVKDSYMSLLSANKFLEGAITEGEENLQEVNLKLQKEIIEHKKLKKKLLATQEELDRHRLEAEKSVKQFLALELVFMLAHELKQPLTAICNYARGCIWAIRDNAEKDKIIAILEEIIAQGDRTTKIFQTLREFFSDTRIEREHMDLNKVVKDALNLTFPAFENSNVAQQLDLQADLPLVSVNKLQIEIVIINLLTNAIDAMKAACVKDRRITISTACKRKKVVLCITDTGGGVDADKLRKIFEPFYTSKKSGMGLGLSIAKSIILAHGGEITASLEGDGMKFVVTFLT